VERRDDLLAECQCLDEAACPEPRATAVRAHAGLVGDANRRRESRALLARASALPRVPNKAQSIARGRRIRRVSDGCGLVPRGVGSLEPGRP
jgi:hypothetical protein